MEVTGVLNMMNPPCKEPYIANHERATEDRWPYSWEALWMYRETARDFGAIENVNFASAVGGLQVRRFADLGGGQRDARLATEAAGAGQRQTRLEPVGQQVHTRVATADLVGLPS